MIRLMLSGLTGIGFLHYRLRDMENTDFFTERHESFEFFRELRGVFVPFVSRPSAPLERQFKGERAPPTQLRIHQDFSPVQADDGGTDIQTQTHSRLAT